MSEKRTRKEKWVSFKHKWRDFRKQWKSELLVILGVFLLLTFGLAGCGLSFLENNFIMIPTIIGDILVGAVFEVLILGEIISDRKSRRKLYNIIWLSPAEITAKNILGDVRSKPSKGFHEEIYFRDRPEEQQFNDKIKNAFDAVSNNVIENRGVLLTGMPLSGKSRMIYEWLKKNKNEKISVLRLKEILPEFDPDINLIPRNFRLNCKKIIIFDNLHTYILNPYFKELFTQLRNTKAVLIATSRTSFELKKVEDELRKIGYLDYFKEIQINNLKEDSNIYELFEQYIFQKISQKVSKPDFDGNIGSLFLDLDVIKERYDTLCKDIDKIASFFKAIKISYAFDLYEGESRFILKIIKTIFEQKYYQNISIAQGEYDTFIEKICAQEIASGKTKNYLFIEPVYVERIFDHERDIFKILVEDFNFLFNLFENDVFVLNKIGIQIISSNKNLPHNFEPFKKGILCFEKIYTLQPDDPDALINLGVAYAGKGELDKAIEKFQETLALRPDDPDALINLGVAYAKKGELDKAIEKYQEALALRPDYPDALINLGVAYFYTKNYIEIKNIFDRLLAIDPTYSMGYFHLARLYSIQNNEKEALKFLHIALKMDPSMKRFREDPSFDNIRDTVDFKKLMD